MWKSFNELISDTVDKKIIFWGRGEWVEKTLLYLKCDSVFTIDNNKNEHNTIENDLPVYGPDYLQTIFDFKKDYHIILTTTDFYNVSAQLEELGFVSGTDFSVTPLMLNQKILSELRNYDKTILVSSSDPEMDDDQIGGGLYLYETKSHSYSKVASGITQGFSCIGDIIYFIDDNRGLRRVSKDFKTEYSTLELPKKCRAHGISIDRVKKQVYINFSAMDAVGVVDIEKWKLIETIPVSDKFATEGSACHHINDNWVEGNSLYISMFSFTGNWKKGAYDGGILEYDLVNKKMLGPVVSNLWMPHNIKVIKGMLCYCDSMRGNFHNTTYKISSHFNGFIRGIDFDGRFYIIGQSVHRYFDRMKEFSNNMALDAGFFVYDEENKGCKFYAMPHHLDIHTLAVYDLNNPSSF